MSDDLRTLAQAVVDARAAWLAVASTCPLTGRATRPSPDEWRAMLTAEGNLRYAVHDTTTSKCADVLLAALDAERAQGYARAMGEVVAEVQTRTEAAVSSYYADRSSYREGYSDACDTLCELVQHMAQTRCD